MCFVNLCVGDGWLVLFSEILRKGSSTLYIYLVYYNLSKLINNIKVLHIV